MKLKIGVIGLGYWGPNYIRNFIRHDQTEVIWACDLSDKSLDLVKNYYPHLKITKDYQEILKDPEIQLVAIATPPETHYKISKDALEANKHVLIAKPLATKLDDAEELVSIAQEKGLMIHGDLTYLYTSAIRRIKEALETKAIGEPLYYDSIRANLGLIQNDVNVIWDLAPHDFAIISYLFGFKAKKVFCVGSKHHDNSKGEEMAHITVTYTNNFIAHIHLSWLSPVKLRTILIGGTEKMILFDDVESDEKVRIYDKGVSIPSESITPFRPVYRSGDIIIPKLSNEEAIFTEINEVLNKINSNAIDYDNAHLNVAIINFLEICDRSLKEDRPILIEEA